MSLQERLYHHLPIPLQHVACSVAGLTMKRTQVHRAILDETVQSSELDHAAWCEIRDAKLRAFVKHSATTVPYYRRWFRDQRIDYREIQKLSDLNVLPIIDKALVKEHLVDFRSEATPNSRCRITHTSGTTGSGLVFPVALEAERRQWAVWWRYKLWHGGGPDTWCGQFTTRPVVHGDEISGPFWRYNWPLRKTLFSANHLSEQNIPAYVAELRRTKLPWIHGNSPMLAYLASFVVGEAIDLGYQVKLVTVGSENLSSQQRKLIETAFGVPVRMHYGLTEGVANISERPDGRFYVDEDFAAVEFVPLEHSPGHRIIGTNFTNPAFPLLRYDTGDIASLPEGDGISSRFPGRIVNDIDGRLIDFVVLADGRHTHTITGAFKDITNIREAQIHQTQPGYVTMLIVPNQNYSENDEGKISAETERLFGNGLAISFKYVDSIKKTDSGKLRFIVSSCNQLPSLVRQSASHRDRAAATPSY